MKEIQLTQGQIALIDDEDFDQLNRFKWCASYQPHSGYFYAVSRLKRIKNEPRKSLRMHRIILKVNDPKIFVDHVNHNTLDNRKENLRICNNNENQFNAKMSISNTSGYKGVHWHKHRKMFITHIQYYGKLIHLGYYDNPKEAAKAYNKAALKYHGKFAYINQLN